MPIYKRLPRGKDKTHDEFKDWTMHVLFFIKDNWKTALEFLALAAVAFGVIVGASSYWQKRSYTAAVGLYDAKLKQTDSPEQVEQLVKIAEDYPRTSAGKQAMMMLGDIALKNNDAEKAKSYFQSVAGRSRNMPLLLIAALHRLAEADLAAGNPGAAAETYLKAAADPHNLVSARSRYLAAGAFEKAGKYKDAADIYKQIVDEAGDEDVMLKQKSEERLIWLNATGRAEK